MIKQDEIWGEEPWFDNNISDAILDKVNILDILDKYGIEYIRTHAGNFTHKLRCPLPEHMGGQERTASLCISDKNDFHCFGCNANGNVIDFIMLYRGVPFYKAIEILYNYIGSNGGSIEDFPVKERVKIDPEHTVLIHVFRSGLVIRDFLKLKLGHEDYPKWDVWAKKQFNRLDSFIDKLDDDQWEKAKSYHNKVSEYLKGKS
jgi:hypothetical protein